MKILHTGDLHLDSPFSGLDISRADKRRRELRETFSSMMRYAKEEGVQLVVISGDVFDSAFVTRETVALLIKEFSALSCPVVIAPGNHDPADEGSIWKKTAFPENVYIFGKNEMSRISFPELSLDVYGYGFVSVFQEECVLSGSVEDPEKINILVCHGDTVSPLTKYAHLPVAALKAFGADYAALGHIHTPDSANAALSGIGAYCGCPEGRDFGECGVKGAIVADVEKGKTATRFVRFCKRIYEDRNLNIDGASHVSEVTAKLEESIEKWGCTDEHVLRVTLTGAVSPSLTIPPSAFEEVSQRVFFLEVEDSTSPTWDAESLEADKGIKGELYRTLLPALQSEDGEERKNASLALRYGLAALSGEDISEL